MVKAVLENWRTAPVSERMRATLGFLEKLTKDPAAVGPKDLVPMRLAGVSGQAIQEAVYVCFLFSVMDRLADAFAFDLASPADFQKGARALAALGYGWLSIPG